MALRDLLKRRSPGSLQQLIEQSVKALEAVSELQRYIETEDGASA